MHTNTSTDMPERELAAVSDLDVSLAGGRQTTDCMWRV